MNRYQSAFVVVLTVLLLGNELLFNMSMTETIVAAGFIVLFQALGDIARKL